MRSHIFVLAGACLFLFICPPAYGQTSFGESSDHRQEINEDKDRVAIIELGAATSWNLSGGATTFVPNLAESLRETSCSGQLATKKLTGKPTITVGPITLHEEFTQTFRSAETAAVTGVDELLQRLERKEFDLVAIGRLLILNPSSPELVQRGAFDELLPYRRDMFAQLV